MLTEVLDKSLEVGSTSREQYLLDLDLMSPTQPQACVLEFSHDRIERPGDQSTGRELLLGHSCQAMLGNERVGVLGIFSSRRVEPVTLGNALRELQPTATQDPHDDGPLGSQRNEMRELMSHVDDQDARGSPRVGGCRRKRYLNDLGKRHCRRGDEFDLGAGTSKQANDLLDPVPTRRHHESTSRTSDGRKDQVAPDQFVHGKRELTIGFETQSLSDTALLGERKRQDAIA